MELKGGVLIIGSLFWQDDQGKEPYARRNWRNEKLSFNERLHVLAPIRYGRTSEKGTITMVLSKDVELKTELGTAYVIPFNSEIKSLEEIQIQARCLSKVEGSCDEKIVKGKNNWCVIGILLNPLIKDELKNEILNYWNRLILDEGGFNHLEYCISPESPVVSSNGEVIISWIRTVDPNLQKEFDKFDFIMATCTKPDIISYPTVEVLKENIKNDPRKYFYNNIQNGINTFSDRKVLGLE